MDHTIIARVLAKNAEILAISIEVEGMKTANMERYSKGEALAYPYSEFSRCADEVLGKANELFQMSF